MAVTLDFSRPLTYEDVGMVPSAVGDMVIAQTAARLFAKVQKGWPVDTSFSRGGLAYRLERIPNGARIIFTNLRDYAIWVERRWYPLDKVVTEGAVRSAAREARKEPLKAELRFPTRLSNLTNNRARSRPVTVRRIEPPKDGMGALPSTRPIPPLSGDELFAAVQLAQKRTLKQQRVAAANRAPVTWRKLKAGKYRSESVDGSHIRRALVDIRKERQLMDSCQPCERDRTSGTQQE